MKDMLREILTDRQKKWLPWIVAVAVFSIGPLMIYFITSGWSEAALVLPMPAGDVWVLNAWGVCGGVTMGIFAHWATKTMVE